MATIRPWELLVIGLILMLLPVIEAVANFLAFFPGIVCGSGHLMPYRVMVRVCSFLETTRVSPVKTRSTLPFQAWAGEAAKRIRAHKNPPVVIDANPRPGQ